MGRTKSTARAPRSGVAILYGNAPRKRSKKQGAAKQDTQGLAVSPPDDQTARGDNSSSGLRRSKRLHAKATSVDDGSPLSTMLTGKSATSAGSIESTSASSFESLSSARLAMSLLQSVAEAFQNVPYIKVAAGLALQIIQMADDIRVNKERSRELVDKVVCYSRIVFEALHRSSLRSRDRFADLREDLLQIESVLKAIYDVLVSFTKGSITKRVSRVLQRTDIFARIQELDRRLDTAVNSFQFKCAISLRIGNTLNEPQVLTAPSASPQRPRTFRRLRSKPQIMFGRDEELGVILKVVLDNPPARIALLGPGGIGKTSVALSVLHADRVSAEYGNARLFISCEAATSAEFVLTELASALQIPTSGSEQVYASVLHALRQSPFLILFDNLETLWDKPDARTDIEALLGDITSLDNVAVLVTLRGTDHPAGVRWSQPLLPPLKPLNPEPASAIFHAISGKMDPFVAKLVSAVDCIPLAVTLLANLAAVDGETPEALWHRWTEEQTAMVERGAGDRLTSLDYSIRLSLASPQVACDADAVPLLSLLSLLPDGMSPHTLAQLASAFPHLSSLKRPASTLRRSALAYIEPGTEALRVLNPIRLFMQANHPPDPESRRALHAYYVELALEDIKPDDTELLMLFKIEAGNIEAVLIDALKMENRSPDIIEAVLNFSRYAYTFGLGSSTALSFVVEQIGHEVHAPTKEQELPRQRQSSGFLRLRGVTPWAKTHQPEGQSQDGHVDSESKMYGDCLGSWGQVLGRQGKLVQAEKALRRALEYHTKAGDVHGRAGDLHNLGCLLSRDPSSLDDAEKTFQEALELRYAIGDTTGGAYDLMGLGHIWLQRSKPEYAQEHFLQALNIHADAKDPQGQGSALNALGHAQLAACKFSDAETQFTAALTHNTAVGDVAGQAESHAGLAYAHLLRSRFSEAQSAITAALALRRGAGDVVGEGDDLHTLGRVYLASGRLTLAADTLSRALAIHTQAGDAPEQADDRHYLAQAHFAQGQVRSATDLLAQATAFYALRRHAPAAADVLASASVQLIRRGQRDEAEAILMRAQRAHADGANVLGHAYDLYHLGRLALRRGLLDTAEQHLQRALALHVQTGSVQGQADAVLALADVALARGGLDAAAVGVAHALALYSEIGDVLGQGGALRLRARVLLAGRRGREAVEAARQALRCHTDTGAPYGEAQDLCVLGAALLVQAEGGEEETDMDVDFDVEAQRTEALAVTERALELFQATEAREEEDSCRRQVGEITALAQQS